MNQISFYQTETVPFEKTLAQIVEKCYHSSLRCTILTPNIEALENLNKYLWTYSQKQFIPHGSKLDPLPDRQPIYITDYLLENPNKSTVLILANCCNTEISSSIINQTEDFTKYNYERVIVMFDIKDEVLEKQIKNFRKELITKGLKLEYYTQTSHGWAKENN